MRSESSKPRRKKNPSPMDSLTDDIVVDILSRLPLKSLCRCKGVSQRFRTIISFENQHRRKLSQTLPGLFYSSSDSRRFPKEARHFTHVWEGRREPLVCPSLSFLPESESLTILNCCNGMLLCRFSESGLDDDFRYVVCNPVEMTYIVLPDSGCGANRRVARLGFDPALYPELHVFEVVNDEENGDVFGVNIFSNRTGAWSYKESQWDPDAFLYNFDCDESSCLFSKGFLHLLSGTCYVLLVDVEGDSWFTISLPSDVYPDGGDGCIGIYEEYLCYIAEASETYDLSIWILEDTINDYWVMTHKVSLDLLCEKQIGQYQSSYCHVIRILQDCNLILYKAGNTLMAYDIDLEKVYAIQNLEECSNTPFFLYVPFYTD